MNCVYWCADIGFSFEACTAMSPSKEEFDNDSFVPAVVARSRQEAEEYCLLFSDHDIPAQIGDEDSLDDEKCQSCGIVTGVPVLVTKGMLDEAAEVLANREDLEGFQIDEDDDQDEDDAELASWMTSRRTWMSP